MRPYYNERMGNDDRPRLTLTEVASQLVSCHMFIDRQGHLQKAFGYHCVDVMVPAGGDYGSDLGTHFYLTTGLRIDSSVTDFIRSTDEVGLFTLVEFLHDHVAKPLEGSGRYHAFSGCGWHFNARTDKFDIDAARQEWRDKVNAFLKFYEDGFELSFEGEIVRLVPDGMVDLVQARAPAEAGDTNLAKLNNAVRIFRLGRSTREQRKQAVRELADLLEFYRPQPKARLLKKAEADLLNIANNFAIRHHNQIQKDEYDDPWLTWLFYWYLATVRLVLELVHGSTEAEPQPNSTATDDGDDIPFKP